MTNIYKAAGVMFSIITRFQLQELFIAEQHSAEGTKSQREEGQETQQITGKLDPSLLDKTRGMSNLKIVYIQALR